MLANATMRRPPISTICFSRKPTLSCMSRTLLYNEARAKQDGNTQAHQRR